MPTKNRVLQKEHLCGNLVSLIDDLCAINNHQEFIVVVYASEIKKRKKEIMSTSGHDLTPVNLNIKD